MLGTLTTNIQTSTALADDIYLSADDNATSSFTGNVIFTANDLTYKVANDVTVSGNFIVNMGITGSKLYFSGGTEKIGSVGTSEALMDTVVLNSSHFESKLTLTGDIWSNITTVGNGVSNQTTVIIDNGGITFGGDVTLANSKTNLIIGESRNTIISTLLTNGGSFYYTLKPEATSANSIYQIENFDFLDNIGSGKISTGSLSMSGGEKFNLNFTGSFKDNATYVLISNSGSITGEYDQDEISGFIVDNSYVLNSSISTNDNNTILLISRSEDEYISKSYTEGHFSNPAALALGTIAKEGKQLGDLVDVITLLDIDNYGYGNDYIKLAEQLKLLAPVANNAFPLTMLAASDLALDQIEKHLFFRASQLPEWKSQSQNRIWASSSKQVGEQSGVDDFDGYNLSLGETTIGVDLGWGTKFQLGIAQSIGVATIIQNDFRQSETATLNHSLTTIYTRGKIAEISIDSTASSGSGLLTTQRQTALDRIASSEIQYHQSEFRLNLSTAQVLDDQKSVLTPLLGIEWTLLEQSQYTETGAGDLSLKIMDQNNIRIRSKLGGQFQTDMFLWSLTPRLSIFFFNFRDYGLRELDIKASFTGPTDSSLSNFTIETAPIRKNTVQFGTDLAFNIFEAGWIQIGYRLDHRVSYSSHSGYLDLEWRF